MLTSVIRKRRGIRKFENKPIEPEKVNILIEAEPCAHQSRRFIQWEFVVATRQDVMR